MKLPRHIWGRSSSLVDFQPSSFDPCSLALKGIISLKVMAKSYAADMQLTKSI